MNRGPQALLLEELSSLGGAGLEITRLDTMTNELPPAGPGVVRVGLDSKGGCPRLQVDGFDILLTVAADAPAPWVCLPAGAIDAALAHLNDTVSRQPSAAAAVAQVLRATLSLPFAQAQMLESMSYSMLLASESFHAWRASVPIRQPTLDEGPRVLMSREEGVLRIRLNRAGVCNAVDSRMRDSLVEALQFAIDDPDAEPVLLSGEGSAFCAGGDLNEFGKAEDPAVAHLIRLLRAPACLIYRIRERVCVRVQGACIGAGIEMAAAAGRVVALPDVFFRLPEVAMGLIPGAGGTASIPRRIGRHRTCFMALTGWDVDAATALSWGLIDALHESA